MTNPIQDVVEQLVEQQCQEIADGAVEECISTMFSMCGNAGQESIIGGAADNAADCVDEVAQGIFGGFDSDHMEAVYIIVGAGNDILGAASDTCSALRLASSEDEAEE